MQRSIIMVFAPLSLTQILTCKETSSLQIFYWPEQNKRYEHKPVHEKDMLKVARKGLGFTQHKNESTQEIPVVDRLNPARLTLEVQSVDCHPITDSHCA
jgi:hypothetical protein